MADPTKCLTPGAIYNFRIRSNKVFVEVELPFDLEIDESEAEILETLMHNSMESILRPYFKNFAKNGEVN